MDPTAKAICIACIILLSLGNLFESTLPQPPSAGGAIAPNSEPIAHPRRHRYAVANFVDGTDELYGVYSIHRMLRKHGMTLSSDGPDETNLGVNIGRRVEHVAVVDDGLMKEHRNVLVSWLGEDNVRTVDRSYIMDKISMPGQDLLKEPFNKLWLFNLTDFDKVIMLDADVLIRSNILHWLDYPAPCGVQAKDGISWNSGAMVIRPDERIFEQMVGALPNVAKFDESDVGGRDPLTSGRTDQDFITAFFLTESSKKSDQKRCIMPPESSVPTSSLGEGGSFEYYNRFRPWMYQTVHFTSEKPWRLNHFQYANKQNRTVPKPITPFLCKILREWKESVHGIEEYYDRIPPLEFDYFAQCK